MKKKIIITLGVTALTLSIGTAALAAGGNEVGITSFKDMLPHMKQVHPDLNEKQLNDMYNNCHNSTDVMNQNTSEQSRMHSSNMMNWN